MGSREKISGEPLIQGTFAWPRKLLFLPDALGSKHRISFDLVQGEISLPSFPPSNAPSDLLPPEAGFSPGKIDWGMVLTRPIGLSLVKVVGVSVFVNSEAAEDSNPPSLHMIAIDFAQGLDPWLYRMRAWLAAIMETDLVIEAPSDLPGSIPEGLALYEKMESNPSQLPTPHRPANWNLIEPSGQAWHLDSTRAVPLSAWSRAIRLANAKQTLPVERELLSSARSALTRGSTRLAVIEAGTAAEVSLGGALRARLRSTKEPAAIDRLVRRKGLSQLHQLAKKFAVPCPQSIEDLLSTRNAAAHRAETPSAEAASKAMTIASEIVNIHSPLPP